MYVQYTGLTIVFAVFFSIRDMLLFACCNGIQIEAKELIAQKEFVGLSDHCCKRKYTHHTFILQKVSLSL